MLMRERWQSMLEQLDAHQPLQHFRTALTSGRQLSCQRRHWMQPD